MKKHLFLFLTIIIICWVLVGCGQNDKSSKTKYSEGLEFTLNRNGESYSVTGIGTCTDTKVVIPSIYNEKPVTSINSYAFYNLTSITSIIVPDSVTSIGASAFSGCSSLESITLPFVGSSASAKSASSNALFGYIFGTSSYTGGTETKQYYNSSIYYDDSNYSTYYIPTSLKTVTITGGNLYYGAFYNCSNLISITLGDSVTIIGDKAFYGLTSLKSIEIPDSVTSVGNYAFEDCMSLATVVIGDSVTSVGNYAFEDCISLATVVISDSVTTLGSGAFSGCKSLTSINIPDSVTIISDGTFSGCTSLTSIEIPDSVTTIGDAAFGGCTSLTSIEIPVSVTSIGYVAFFRCTYITIYCEAESKPSGWSNGWNNLNLNGEKIPVVWNYKK